MSDSDDTKDSDKKSNEIEDGIDGAPSIDESIGKTSSEGFIIPPQLGKFEIVEEIGAGGWGIIYLGIHSLTKRKRAIKILKPKWAKDKSSVEMFIREAQAQDVLNECPNIVKFYDIGVDKELHWMELEYIEGKVMTLNKTKTAMRSLQQWVNYFNGRPLNQAWVKQIALDVLKALALAHRNNMVHRDIKPSNILITENGTAKLSDFGMVKLKKESALRKEHPEYNNTSKDGIKGNLLYLSPEQKNQESLDGRSDLYAFGMVIYLCLTGYNADGLFDMPSQIDLDIDPAWDHIIKKSMQNRREKRWNNAEEMAQAIRAIPEKKAASDEDKPVTNIPSTPINKATKKTKSSLFKVLFFLSILFGILVMAAVNFPPTKKYIEQQISFLDTKKSSLIRNHSPKNEKAKKVEKKEISLKKESSEQIQKQPLIKLNEQLNFKNPKEVLSSSAGFDLIYLKDLNCYIAKTEMSIGCVESILGSGYKERIKDMWHKEWPKQVPPPIKLLNDNNPDHLPAVYISLLEAEEIAKRITQQDIKNKIIPSNWEYRLLTNSEWNFCVGFNTSKKNTMFNAPHYPWGKDISGGLQTVNLLGKESKSIKAEDSLFDINLIHNDPFITLAPVTWGRKSSHGLLGLAGNVSEWIGEPTNPGVSLAGGVRGSNWLDYGKYSWRSNIIREAEISSRYPFIGFRLALSPKKQKSFSKIIKPKIIKIRPTWKFNTIQKSSLQWDLVKNKPVSVGIIPEHLLNPVSFCPLEFLSDKYESFLIRSNEKPRTPVKSFLIADAIPGINKYFPNQELASLGIISTVKGRSAIKGLCSENRYLLTDKNNTNYYILSVRNGDINNFYKILVDKQLMAKPLKFEIHTLVSDSSQLKFICSFGDQYHLFEIYEDSYEHHASLGKVKKSFLSKIIALESEISYKYPFSSYTVIFYIDYEKDKYIIKKQIINNEGEIAFNNTIKSYRNPGKIHQIQNNEFQMLEALYKIEINPISLELMKIDRMLNKFNEEEYAPQKAYRDLLKLARSKNVTSEAQQQLAKLYKEGIGTAKNIKKALYWYDKASDTSIHGLNERTSIALENWVDLQLQAKGENITSEEEVRIYTLAAKRKHGNSINWLINNTYNRDFLEDHSLLKQASMYGSPSASVSLARTYFNGDPSINLQKDEKKGFQLLIRANDQGYYEQQEIAECFEQGKGVKKSLPRAFQYYLKDANSYCKKDSLKNIKVAEMYEKGEGVKQSLTEALKWYKLSADLGDPDAKKKVSELEKP